MLSIMRRPAVFTGKVTATSVKRDGVHGIIDISIFIVLFTSLSLSLLLWWTLTKSPPMLRLITLSKVTFSNSKYDGTASSTQLPVNASHRERGACTGANAAHVAVVFWGLARSLRFTLTSIQQALDALRCGGRNSVTTFFHTYTLARPYSNRFAGEPEMWLNNSEHTLLGADEVVVEDMDSVSRAVDWPMLRSFGDPWADLNLSWEVHRHMVLALYSQCRVTRMALHRGGPVAGTNFTHFLFMRPDVNFSVPLDPMLLHLVGPNEAAAPFFGYWDMMFLNGSVPVNDRFLLAGSAGVAATYGCRLDRVASEYPRELDMHAERFAGWSLRSRNISVLYVPLCFSRIRATGAAVTFQSRQVVSLESGVGGVGSGRKEDVALKPARRVRMQSSNTRVLAVARGECDADRVRAFRLSLQDKERFRSLDSSVAFFRSVVGPPVGSRPKGASRIGFYP
jgi:hypothetical protein